MVWPEIRWTDFLFIFPAIFLIVIFVVIPVFHSILLSFYNNTGFVGIQNYTELFSDKSFFNLNGFFSEELVGTLGNNIIWILLHMPASIILGLTFALLLNSHIYGRGSLRTLIFMGTTVPMVVGGILARFLFAQSSGLVPSFFHLLGMDALYVNWLAKPGLALYALVLISIWLWVGYCMIMYMSALNTVDQSIIEAAQMDGASRVRILFQVLLPHLKPVTYVIVAMSLIWELKLFDIVYASTGGGPGDSTSLLSLEMYQSTFRYFQEGKGTAIAVLMMLLCVAPITFLIKNQAGTNAI